MPRPMKIEFVPGEVLFTPVAVVLPQSRQFVCRECGIDYTRSERLALPTRESEGISVSQHACAGCGSVEFHDRAEKSSHHEDHDYGLIVEEEVPKAPLSVRPRSVVLTDPDAELVAEHDR